jgi:hypothetical protein
MKTISAVVALTVVALMVVFFCAFKMATVKADEAGNHRIYLTGYSSFVNEDSAVAIYRDSKTNTEFVCFRHTYGTSEAYSCTQLDPTKAVKP